MAPTRAFCFPKYRWKNDGIGRGSSKKPAPKRVCTPAAGRMRTQTSSCLPRWYSARTGRKRLRPRRLCLQAYPHGQEGRRQVYRRTEPCSFPKTKHWDEVTAQLERARASAQQIDGIECTQSGSTAAVMKVDLRRDRKLVAPQHSAKSSQSREDKLRSQPCCRRPRNLRQQANHKYQRRTRKGEQELGSCNGAVGWTIAGTNAADAQPASEGNACHAHRDEDCELVVNVTVDGLKCQQQENLQSHQCESCRSHTVRCGGAGAFLASGHKHQKNRHKQ